MIPLYFPSFSFGVREICRLLSFILLLWCCLSNRIGIPRLTYLHFFAIHLGQVLQQNLAIFLFFAKNCERNEHRFEFRIWHERYRTFFTVFSCYMYCVDLYVSKTFVYVYLCCYSQKRFIIWKENQIILSCASAVAPPLLGTAPNPQKRVGGSGCHCNRLYHVAHNFCSESYCKRASIQNCFNRKNRLYGQFDEFFKEMWLEVKKCYQTGKVCIRILMPPTFLLRFFDLSPRTKILWNWLNCQFEKGFFWQKMEVWNGVFFFLGKLVPFFSET